MQGEAVGGVARDELRVVAVRAERGRALAEHGRDPAQRVPGAASAAKSQNPSAAPLRVSTALGSTPCRAAMAAVASVSSG